MGCSCGRAGGAAGAGYPPPVGDGVPTAAAGASPAPTPPAEASPPQGLGDGARGSAGDAAAVPADAAHPAAAANQPGSSGQEVERILAACSTGRALEALRLLDALHEDDLVGEAEAARIRGVARSFNEVIASMNAVLETVAHGAAPRSSKGSGTASSWSSRSVDNGDVHFKYDKSTGDAEVVGLLSVEIEAVEMWALLREFDLAHGWVPRVVESGVLHSFAPNRDVYKVDYTSPNRAFISPMVAFHDRTYFDALDELGCLAVVVDGPDTAETTWQGLSLPPAPKGVKRLHQHVINRVQPVAQGRCLFSMHIFLSTGLYWLPDWLVGVVATAMVNQLAACLQTTKARWASGGWKQRLESGPRAEYYASLQQRVETLLAESADTKPGGDPLTTVT